MTDSMDPRGHGRSRTPSWIGLWIGLLLLGIWLRWPVPWVLVIPPALVLERVLRARPLGRAAAVAAVALLAGSVAGFSTHQHLHRIETDWDRIWETREEQAAETLGEELDGLVESGQAAIRELAEAVAAGEAPPGSSLLGQLRNRYDLEAMAVYGPDGSLEVWDGVHRGTVPEDVRFGDVPFAYGERPLFSYLYFTRTIPSTGGTAVGAYLLNMALPPGLQDGGDDFVSRVEAETGEALTISRSERMLGESVWDFRWEETNLFSAAVVEPRRGAERDRVLTRWGRIAGLLLALGWISLALGVRDRIRETPAAAASLVALAVVLPVGRLAGTEELDSPSAFLLASPVDATFLRTLVVAAAATLALGMLAGWWRHRREAGVPGGIPAVVAVAAGFPLAVWLFRSAPSPNFLVDSETPFVLVQAALALVLSLVALGGLLSIARRAGGTGHEAEAGLEGEAGGSVEGREPGVEKSGDASRWLLWGGLAAAAALATGSGALVVARGNVPLGVAALWALPAWAVVTWRRRARGRPPGGSLLVLAGMLGVTCALPFAWETRVRARMELGEAQLGRLDAAADPYTEFLLQRFANRVDSLDQSAVGPVELLYSGWVESGLAEEGIPAWLTLWSPGDLPVEDLRIGVPPPRPSAADEFLAEARVSAVTVIRRLRRPDVRYVAVVPLTSGNAVTAVVPPRSVTPTVTSLEPLFGGAGGSRDPLQLVPLLPGDVPVAPDTTVWNRTTAGWRGERTLELPDGGYHAHYVVELAGPTLLMARATLLLALDLAILGILFGSGLILTSSRTLPARRLFGVFRTFQGRVTMALFGFFLLSVTVLGLLAYRTLSGASERTATALADRVVDESAGWYLEVQGAVDLLARRVGSDLLEYQGGRLAGGSASEMVELGLYEGWLPYPIHEPLEEGHALTARAVRSVGSWEYVVAYRRMPDGTVLGAPVPLEAGAAALRRREMIDLLGFALLLGGALSLGLAYLVGRTLARPIRELRSVTGRVGRGDLRVQLPEERLDEFSAVFEDFNRMVIRLREARRDLVRTTRRTQAIIDEAAMGVMALDPDGEVTLVNPRAQELLRTEVETGTGLPRNTDVAMEIADWVRGYLDDGLNAGSTEIHDGERRIRVQARRISGRDRRGGLVLSLEDVADELRTERILAWGEMAQQVAHEVKNPLTPIKLGVQHIRRAWEDQRSDFGEILGRNVEATLAEIDRLASIARSFSRFAAPEVAGEAPLGSVDLARVVEETLDLYSMDEGRVRFEAEVPGDLPPVRSRASEVKEVLVNLLENARSAIEEEGTVRVEVEPSEEGVELRVRDDGPGIPGHLLPRIFEPHFSTRSSGTGLGLAIVRRLVESWGGTVTAESRVGTGTVVSILLPRWPEGGDGPGEPGDVSTV